MAAGVTGSPDGRHGNAAKNEANSMAHRLHSAPGMRSRALSILCLVLLTAPAGGENTRQRYYFKHGNNLHKEGERLKPRWCQRLLNASNRLEDEGAGKERLLQRAWKKYGAPKGLPSRLDSVFVALHPRDWNSEMSKCFVYAVKAPRGAKVTVRDARYGSRCFTALQHYSRATDPRTKRRWLGVALRAARDYWRKPGTAPGAWPEALIEGGVTVKGTLNEPEVNAFMKTLERCKPAPLPPYPGTPVAGEQRALPKPARQPQPSRSAPVNPLMLNPFVAFWFGR
jgi:hypothetical protein